MVFHSFEFILIFLPAAVAGWYACIWLSGRPGKRFDKLPLVFISAMSMLFYGLFSVQFLIILLVGAAASYLCAFAISKSGDESRIRTVVSAAGIIIQLSILFVFKYYGFFTDNLNRILGTDHPLPDLIMPVGISFYTFSQISFIIDVKRKEQSLPTPLEYLCFVTFFPKLLQGPIAVYSEITEGLKSVKGPDPVKIKKGIILFTLGLSKKVLLSDAFAGVSDYGFAYTYGLDTLTGVLVLISYAFQLYFDFSGYCDMAAGISCLLGTELPVNFNSPYQATDSRQLWQRWHMTLSRFFVRYVYIPLGGSRRGTARTILNILIVFVLSGLWHGAGWTYICWGLMQGLLVVWDFIRKKLKEKHAGGVLSRTMPEEAAKALTFSAFVLSLVFFRSADLAEAFRFFKGLVHPTLPGLLILTARNMELAENYLLLRIAERLPAAWLSDAVHLITWGVLLVLGGTIVRGRNSNEIADRLCDGTVTGVREKRAAILLGIVFAASCLSLGGVSEFMYFRY